MEIRETIQRLKKEQDAVILAHYYVRDEVQEMADYIGDSFYLSKLAVDLPQKTLVVCGVSFMGESAKILNPGKRVLLPDPKADCAMAHMITPEKVAALRQAHPKAAVVCYINSTAELKTCSDVCVTSANALKIVRALMKIWAVTSPPSCRRKPLFSTTAAAPSTQGSRLRISMQPKPLIPARRCWHTPNAFQLYWKKPITSAALPVF